MGGALLGLLLKTQGGKSLLWIPYYHLWEDNGIDGYFNRVSNIASCIWGNRPLLDTILLQPGSFYQDDGRGVGAIQTITNRIINWNRDQGHKGIYSTLGIQLEFDMGLVTGRSGGNYDLSASYKKDMLKAYLDVVPALRAAGAPIGSYSGGPNEQGYANPEMNAYRHNTGNYMVEGSGLDYGYGNGWSYNDSRFPRPYNGNLIYDINNYLFGRGMNDKLANYLK